MFGAVSVAGAMGVVLTLLVTPTDDYDQELEDREQLEYLEEWRQGMPCRKERKNAD
jgi:hypothetical protein